MTQFWIICAALLVVALPFIALPLWRGAGGTGNVIRHDAANLDILRDQFAELDADLRDGLLAQDAYEQGRRELQARLLEEAGSASAEQAGQRRNPAKILALTLTVLLPLFSVLLYLAIGNTKALLSQQQTGLSGEFGIIRSEAKLQELEKELAQRPENPDGWVVLARSYSELQRFPDAVRAYGQLVKLVSDEAQIWASYADVYAMTQNQSLRGEPTKFLNRALELDGNNTMALALSGSAAMERGDYAAAIAHWTKLVEVLPPDTPDAQMIRDGIEQARAFLAMQKGGRKQQGKSATGK